MELTNESLKVTNDNYHSVEADKEYLSVSQLKAYEACPYAWYFTFRDPVVKRDITSKMIAGTYAHVKLLTPALFPAFIEANESSLWDSHGRFYQKAPRMGEEKAMISDVLKADAIVEALQKQPAIMSMLDISNHEQVITGTFAGTPFKVMLDAMSVTTLDDRPWFADLKTTNNFSNYWHPRAYGYVPWHYNHWFQMAVYKHMAEILDTSTARVIYIIGGTRQTPPDLALIRLEGDKRIEEELVRATALAVDINDNGNDLTYLNKKACGTCPVCRADKFIDGPIGAKGDLEEALQQKKWAKYRMRGLSKGDE